MKKNTPLVPLLEVCQINPKSLNGFQPNTGVTFVPMAAVDEKTAKIQYPVVRTYQEVAKGFSVFKEDDVLFAKITPCMENGKCAIARNLLNGWGFGSTEFHVLRASDKIIPSWIFYFLRQEQFRQFAAANMTGTAGQQRVPKSFFEKVKIPLPPLPVQRKITAILEKADAAREKRRQANQLTEQFLQSTFLEMIDDPVTNPKKFEMKKFGDVARINMGQSPPGDSYNNTGEGIPLLNGPTEFGVKSPTEKQWTIKPTKLAKKGEILFCVRGATAGRMNWADKEYCIGRGLASISSLDVVLNEYVYFFLLNKYNYFQNLGQGSTFINLNRDLISDIKIPVPPLSEQRKFAKLVEKVESLHARQRQSEQELENLFNSLMQRAFRGEL